MNIKKISVAVCFLAVFAVFGIASYASALTISRDLTVGSSGTDVKSLQQFLNNNGYTVSNSGVGSKGYETTLFGNLTAAAVKKFQSANGLSQTGTVDSSTRTKLAAYGSSSTSSNETLIATLRAQLAALQQQLAELMGSSSSTSAPYITSIKVSDGGDEDYVDKGDQIVVTFNKEIDPESINDDLEEGNTITGITYNEVGGVSVTSAGKLTIKGIASFYVGDVEDSSLFTSKLALSSSGKILTITLTSGSDVEITDEDFDSTVQIGGTITDTKGNEMESDSSIDDPTGTFGGSSSSDDSDDDDDAIDISSIVVTNGGSDGVIDEGDKIKITFDTAIKASSINSDLDAGDSVTGVEYSDVGGVQVSSTGKVTIKGIAYFDMGEVSDSGTFTSELALSSSGKVLTITLSDGDDIDIDSEDFGSAYQVSGTIEDEDGNEMEAQSSVCTPTGTFGGDSSSSSDDDEEGPSISTIIVADNGDEGYIDAGDTIKITFDEAIDPESINSSLETDSYVTGIAYSKTGGVSVSSAGKVTIKNIASFDMGDVADSGTFTVKLALNSTGKILTITLTSGDSISIDSEDFGEATQITGYVTDEDGNEMEEDSSACTPSGTFGGSDSSDEGPSIDSIVVYSGGDEDGVIDEGDYIKITFSKAIKASSVNSGLDAGESIEDLVSDETGGVSISSSGVVTIKNIATFDVGSVNDSGTFESSVALSSDGTVLTITLTNGDSIEISDEDYGTAKQLGSIIEDEDGNEMAADSSIDDPTGGF